MPCKNTSKFLNELLRGEFLYPVPMAFRYSREGVVDCITGRRGRRLQGGNSGRSLGGVVRKVITMVQEAEKKCVVMHPVKAKKKPSGKGF